MNYRRVHCILLHFSKWRNHHKTQQRAHTKNTENLLKKLKKRDEESARRYGREGYGTHEMASQSQTQCLRHEEQKTKANQKPTDILTREPE